MNLSGESIKEVIDFYKVSTENLIIIYDDIDIEPGIIKLRKTGGPGTHNGMKSVINKIGTEKFPRVRIGIGKPEYKGDLINYVIGKIPNEDKKILEKSTDLAKDAVIEIIKYNYKVGILPIVITICIELIQCLIFFTGGTTFYNILMFSRLPNYMSGIAIIMCFSIIYTIYVSRHQKKIQ